MRSTLILLPVIGATLAISGASSAAFADSQVGQSGHPGARVLNVTLTNSVGTEVDLKEPGPSAGDRFSVYGDLVRHGSKAGTGGYECVTVMYKAGSDPAGPPAAESDLCSGTLALKEGQISIQGLVDRTGPIPVTIAVVGGTGAYRTAHGELQTSGPNEAGDEPLILRIIY